jgi:hypothetical protein
MFATTQARTMAPTRVTMAPTRARATRVSTVTRAGEGARATTQSTRPRVVDRSRATTRADEATRRRARSNDRDVDRSIARASMPPSRDRSTREGRGAREDDRGRARGTRAGRAATDDGTRV